MIPCTHCHRGKIFAVGLPWRECPVCEGRGEVQSPARRKATIEALLSAARALRGEETEVDRLTRELREQP